MSCWILDQLPGVSLPRTEPSCLACSSVTVRAPLTAMGNFRQRSEEGESGAETKRTHRRVVLVVAADARHHQFRRTQTPKRKMTHLYSSGLVSFRVEYIPEVWL